MRRSICVLTIVLPVTLAHAAPATDQAALDTALVGRIAGKPQSCVNLQDIDSTTTYSNPDTILYRMRSGALYVNQPAGGCGLRGDPILVTRTPSTRLCRGDILSLVDRASRFPRGGCGLGDFVPYTKVK